MIKTCPMCNKQFETYDLRRVYCNADCARRARSKQNSKRGQASRAGKRMEWAYREAEKLMCLVVDDTSMNVLAMLADYIYNNYNKRSE